MRLRSRFVGSAAAALLRAGCGDSGGSTASPEGSEAPPVAGAAGTAADAPTTTAAPPVSEAPPAPEGAVDVAGTACALLDLEPVRPLADTGLVFARAADLKCDIEYGPPSSSPLVSLVVTRDVDEKAYAARRGSEDEFGGADAVGKGSFQVQGEATVVAWTGDTLVELTFHDPDLNLTAAISVLREEAAHAVAALNAG